MNDLKEIWNTIDGDDALTTEHIKRTIHSKSHGVIGKLAQKVKIKMFYCILFLSAFGMIIPFAMPLASQILLSILWAAYLVGAILLYKEYQILKKGIDMSQDLLHALMAYQGRILKVIKYEELVGLVLYPISVAGGFFYGMKISAPDAEIMDKPLDWIVLIIAIGLLTLGGDWFAKWMNRKAFGKYLKQLEEHILALSSDRDSNT